MLANKKHIIFVDEFLRTGKMGPSYKTAFGAMSDSVASTSASRLLKKPEIINEINSRQSLLRNMAALTKQDLIDDLIDIKNQTKTSFPPSSLKAIEILNKMLGFNEPDKIELKQDIELTLPGVTKIIPLNQLEDLDDEEDQG